MKIGLFSDLHLGFGSGTEREKDAFDNLKEAIEMCKDCDLILIAGDLFDNKTPTTETLTKSMETLLSAFSTKTGTNVLDGMNKNTENILKFGYGIPIIAIHGNHERRSKGLLNPVEALEKAGFLAYLHGNGIVLEKDGISIAVQGIGGVPDQIAEKVFNEWYPRPKDGCYNILLMHQSFDGFVYAEHTVSKDEIPRGFDLYINGHIHDPSETVYDGKPFIHPGGLVITQVTANTKPVRVYKIDVNKTDTFTAEIRHEELHNQRKFYNIENDSIVDVGIKLKEILDSEHGKKPLIKIKTKESTDELKIKYGEKALFSFASKKDDKVTGVSIEDHKLSVDELGKKLLRENMEKEGLNTSFFENIFELLVEKQHDKVVELLEK